MNQGVIHFFYLDVLEKTPVSEIHIRHFRQVGYIVHVVLCSFHCFPIRNSVYRYFSVFHYVLREGAGFVWKNMYNLPQLFVKRGLINLCCYLGWLCEHQRVAWNEVSLQHLDHIEGDQERNRHKVWQIEHPGKKVNKKRGGIGVFVDELVFVAKLILWLLHVVYYGSNNANRYLQAKDQDNLAAHFFV